MKIETRRFLLRDFIPADEAAFLAYHAEPRFAEFCSPAEMSHSFNRNLLQQFNQWANEYPRHNYQLAIADRRDSVLIGCGGLRQSGYDPGEVELGIELAPQFWGRYAYALEVGQALVNFGFDDLNLSKIRGISVSENRRVSRLAERYGFVAIGTLPGPAWMTARGWHQIEWQLTRETWQQSQT
ncbi:GNAT family N-acetyltransferase [Nodosilinea sp. LEGE 07298]|uniref:GNAT family N-acetyltransferase n=1 Tax=Nodosilinea sp. LEGE 07298 TaxID=2777970 RepID=UPI0018806037|nr:GNAT family N-acetyltransferase [Nodosilinea sp. LEGE 07298]MBE9109066.1 GNAT family N-acetyltransferase [Nodosilinea sp. LEGE 07298]